jgi:hypothetical protein
MTNRTESIISIVRLFSFWTVLLLTGAATLQAQRLVDTGRGDYYQTLKGYMDGNLVSTVYYNYGEIANWSNQADWPYNGVWPKGSGHSYVDGVAIIVQAAAHTNSVPSFHPLETNYYEYTRQDPLTLKTYGWWPLPGYAARFQSNIAQSNLPTTWPSHWPDRASSWDGQWNGFFGRGILNADEESYFVFDDDKDRDYSQKYNFHPDIDNPTRGGLGMQVHARGFQWSQVLAEDVIFWYYEITNMGTTDYDSVLFAQYVDWGIGGHDNSSNNAGDYDQTLNLSYAWSTVGFGSPGGWSPVGYCGYAFLESPGIDYDHIDNDHDGLIDERRDNDARTFINDPAQDPYLDQFNLAQDTALFRQFYGYGWKPHWDADENGNWRAYTDLNHNGKWDSGEPINDDVGSDGIGPLDDGYTGPDIDGSEADGKPEQGEPNFGILDKDESDQLGLTGFLIAAAHTYDLNNDEKNWHALSALPTPHGQQLAGVNLTNFFSSYTFHLPGRNTYSLQTGALQQTGATERFSMGLIFGMNAGDLFRRKRTVQQIYNANYHFAKPPDKPRVKAVTGNHKVTLYWDDRAERTFDAFYQKYNFEGYRVYRSTEPNFIEDKTITDAYGQPTFRVPIAQYDLADGITGLHPITVNGAAFNLGDDSGLQHSFIDSTVENGQTYYYAVCAYDQGFTTTTVNGEFIGIPPSETTSIIKVDASGTLKTDINTAVVTPHAPAAGYVPPGKTVMGTGPGTGSADIAILDPDSLPGSHTFRLEFFDTTAFHNDPNPSYQFVDMTSGTTLISKTKLVTAQTQTTVLDGFAINIKNDPAVTIDKARTGWVTGNSNYIVQVGFDPRYVGAYGAAHVDYPADFELTFTAPGEGDTAFPSGSFSRPNLSNIIVKNLTENVDHWQFIFRDNNNDSTFNAAKHDSDAVFIVTGDSSGKRAPTFPKSKKSWSVTFIADTLIPDSAQRPPQPGDVFRIVTTKPFRTGEYYEFTTTKAFLNTDSAKNQMQNIAVVPNPYVGAASWEPQPGLGQGRGERRVYFIHLPRECTIRIYTLSGGFVQEIHHSSSIDNGQEPWNLISRDGMDISYGIYVFHVDAPGIGTRVDRFAILK